MAGTLTIKAGTTYNQTITFKDSSGNAINLTNAVVKFKIATSLGISDDNATFFVSSSESSGELTISDAVNGVVTLSIPNSTTANFTAGDYYWQLRYIDASTNVNDTDQGICIVSDSLFDDEA